MQLPKPDSTRFKRRGDLISRLLEHLRADQIIHHREDVVAYECDGLSAYRQRPMLVALPDSTEQVAAVLRSCSQLDIPIVPWGAGTGLSGDALPREDGVVLSTARMRAVLDIDLENRAVTVQPGVTNQAVTEAVEQSGFYYAPDPSSWNGSKAASLPPITGTKITEEAMHGYGLCPSGRPLSHV